MTPNNTVYDKTTTAAWSGTAPLSAVIGTDVVTLDGAPTSNFASANTGVGIATTLKGYTISGTSSGNYTLTQPAGLTANLTAKTVTPTGLAVSNKVYDATAATCICHRDRFSLS